MLTIEKLKAMEPESIFAKGVATLPHYNKELDIRWVAVRGGIYDWTIYCGQLSDSEEEIKRSGDKLMGEADIKKYVPCDNEAFKMYRH